MIKIDYKERALDLANDNIKLMDKNSTLHSENEELKQQLILYSVGRSFIHELIQKETAIRTKLAENLDFYKGRESMQMYERTFDLWNKQNLVLWDLKDILCRMGEDLD